MRARSARTASDRLRCGLRARMSVDMPARSAAKPPCISAQMERPQARAVASPGQSPGWRSARYSAMASESHTKVEPFSRTGTRPPGSRAKRSALPASGWSETRCSVKGMPAPRIRIHGRADQEE